MAFALILNCEPDGDLRTRSVLGRHVHAAVLDLIRRGDAAVAGELHDGSRLRPYSVAIPPCSPAEHETGDLPLRIAGLDDRIGDAIGEAVAATHALAIGGNAYRIRDVLHAPASRHPWVGRADLAGLVNLFCDETSRRTIGIEFASPTAFKEGAIDNPLPSPRLVFGSVARRLANAGPLFRDLADTLPDLVQASVAVSGLNGRTAAAEIDDRLRLTGFVGRVTYRCVRSTPIPGRAETVWQMCQVLAEAAFYTGAGQETSRGCGLVRTV